MKNLLITLSLFLTSIYLAAQSQSIEWQTSLGGTGSDNATFIQQTTDGGYIVAGRAQSTDGDVTGNHGQASDYWVVKLTSTGAITWQKSLGGTDVDFATSIQQTTDGGYIVAGFSYSTDGDVTGNHGQADYWVVKLSSTGAITWQKSLGGTGGDFANSIQQTTDGGYIVAGFSNSTNGDVTGNHGSTDYWVVKLDSTGTIIWQKSLGGSGEDFGSSIQQTADGGYIVEGYSSSTDGDVTGNHGLYDSWVVKLDNVGTISWQKSLGGTVDDKSGFIQQTTDGGYIFAGRSQSTDGDVTGNHGSYDYWVVKLSNTGGITWQKSLGGSGNDQASSIQQTTDGGYVVAGHSYSTDGDVTGNHGSTDYWVVKLDSVGTITWQKSFGGAGSDYAYIIHQTTDGGYVVGGESDSQDGDVTGNHGGYDYWVVKLSSTVGVTEITELNEFSVYPNPTSKQITLKANHQLIGAIYTIYDNMGKTVISGQINAIQTVIELGNLSGGIYLFSVGENKQSFKVIKN
ncbi:MAG: T9SS type A sorting domain-containing protein [Flavobacteriales bacterium]|nr:T9SS type A sorting domain-containing protein [Flavobacteriales bacterium]